MSLPESPKDRGHIAELIFAVEAKSRGHALLTTGGDNCPFDAVVYNNRGVFFKVQVKSCLHVENGRDRRVFHIKRGGKHTHRSYKKEDVDVFALYAFDTKEWYLLPVEVAISQKTIKIDSKGAYGQYRENWDIFN